MKLECAPNAGEIYNNGFRNITFLDCSNHSLQAIAGTYNSFSEIFAVQCGEFAFFSAQSNSVFSNIVGDGRIAIKGNNNNCNLVVIEAVHADPTLNPTNPAIELNGASNTYANISVAGVRNVDYNIGISIFGTFNTVSSMTINGVLPHTPI